MKNKKEKRKEGNKTPKGDRTGPRGQGQEKGKAMRGKGQGGNVQVMLGVRGDFVEIKIADDGKGMEKEKLDLAVQPFEEVLGVQDRELRGFGLGLLNVKGYAELHGRSLEAERSAGKGSFFTIRISRHYEGEV